jgi:hypothetical protein
MRATISTITAIALLIIVVYLAYSGSITLPDYWTQLAVTLTAIALGILYWGFKPRIDSLLKEKRRVKNGKSETVLLREKETPKNSLLPDSAKITKLGIENDLLDRVYEQARHQAIELYHDAELSGFNIQIFPYREAGNKANIYFNFYSKWADRICQFQHTEQSSIVRHTLPDKRAKYDSDRKVFTALPWKESPHWMQVPDRVYAKIGPLAPTTETAYYLFAYPPPKNNWLIIFDDAFSGNEYSFEWNGKGLDEQSLKQQN